jgi:protease-4
MKKIVLLFISLSMVIPSIYLFTLKKPTSPEIVKTAKIGWLDITDGISKFEKVVTPLMEFEDDDSIDAIILRIDSAGGTVGDSCIIADYVYHLRAKKPVIAFISNVGASGAYLIATACSYIICAPGASVGNIGVVSSYIYEKDKAYISIVSGKFKTPSLNQNYQISPSYLKEEQMYIDQLAETFIDSMINYRNISKKLITALQARLLSSQKALEYNLVDAVGTLQDLRTKAVQLVSEKNNTTYQQLQLISTENNVIKIYIL